MSKQVDERVVEMRFDNQNFEKNVATSMSTIDKLKQKLNFKGAGKSLEQLNKSAQNVSFEKMADSLSTLEKRFSTTGIVGMSVIQNLTNSAMGFVKKIQGFVVNGVKTGGINRAMKIENARFQLGVLLKDADKVTAVMQNVQAAVDGTAYGMDAAATIASQLAASGMQAGEDMQHSLQAVAGVAAMTNSSYEDIGRIFAQISGQGRLMGNDLLQLSGRGMNAAATLGEALGKTEAEVRDMVSKGQVSFKMFSDAMYDAFGEGSKKANESMNGAFANVKSALAKIGADFVSPLVAQNGPIVKFLNAVREKINDIRKFTTPIATTLSGTIGKWIEKIAGFISKIDIAGKFEKIRKIFNGGKDYSKVTEGINKIKSAMETAKQATEDFGDVVDKVINGQFGNAQERWQKLTDAGYDWAHIQNLVNEKLGSSVRHVTNYQEVQNGLNDAQEVTIDQIVKMSDAELQNYGLTQDVIDAFRDLEKQSEKTGIPIEDLMNNVDQLSGKFLILDSFKNIGKNITKVFKSIGQAFKETFKPKDSSGIIYNIIAGFHKLTERLKMSDETADKLKRTFKGVFSVFSIVGEVIGSAVKHIGKGISSLFESFNPKGSKKSILDLTASLGDKLSDLKVKLVDEGGIDKAFDKVGDTAKNAGKAIKKFIDYIKDSTPVKKFGEALKKIDIKNVGKNIKDLLEKFGELTKLNKIAEKLKELNFGEIGKNLIDGFINGITENSHLVPELFANIGIALLNAIKGVLGIHSPSTKAYEVGQNTIAGLVNGIRDGKYKVTDALAELAEHVKNFLQELPWRQILSLSIIAGITYTGKKILDVMDKFAAPFAGVGAILKSVAGVISQVKLSMDKLAKAKSFNLRMDGILKFVESIALLIGAIIVLAQFDQKKIWQGWLVMAATVGVVILASLLMDKFSTASMTFEREKGFNFKGMKSGLIAIGVTALLIATAVKMIGKLDQDQAKRGFEGLGLVILSILLVTAAAGQVTKNASLKDLVAIGSLVKQLSVALLLMAVAIKLISTIDDPAAVKKAIAFVGLFAGFVIAIAKLGTSKDERHIAKLGGTLIAISVAMLLMVGVMRAVSRLDPEQIGKGIAFMGSFLIFVGVLALVTRAGKNGTAKLGGILLSISLSMILMIGVMKLVNKLDPAEVVKGYAFMLSFILFVGLLNVASRITEDKQIAKLGKNLIAMAIAVGVLAGICVLIGQMDAKSLAKGIVVVGFLSLFMATMMKAAGTMLGSDKAAIQMKQTVIAMTVAVALLAASVVALSLIPPAKLAAATASMSALIAMMSLMMLASEHVGGWKGSTSGLVTMTVMIGLVGIILYTIAKLPWQQSLAAAAGISVVMLSLVASMEIMNVSGHLGKSALASVVLMTGVTAAIGAILYLLKDMDPKSAIGNATAISEVLIALSTAMLILSAAKFVNPATVQTAGYFIVMLGVIASIFAIVGGLLAKIPQAQEFLENGIPILSAIGEALGSFFGGIVKGFSVEATSALPEIGQNIADFANNLSGISDDAVNGAKNAAKVMLAMTGSEILNAIGSFFGGGLLFEKTSMSTMKEKLETFGEAVKGFSDKLTEGDGINSDAINAAANAGHMIAELEKSVPRTGGKLQKFLGEKDLGTFSDRLSAFGDAIVGFSRTVSADGAVNEDAVKAAANAGKALASLNDNLPYSGGKLQKFLGEKNLETFSTNIGIFADAIVSFSQKVSADGAVNADAVDAAANAGQMLSDLNNSLPTTDGGLQWLIGKKDLSSFSTNIVEFGNAIVDFSDKVSEGINNEAIDAAASAGNSLSDLSKSLPEEGFFDGKMSLSDFGAKITTFADCLSSFSGTVSEIDSTGIDTSVKMGEKLVSLSQTAADVNADGITNFANVKNIATVMAEYSYTVRKLKVEEVSTSVSSAKTLVSIVNSLVGVDYSGIDSFSKVSDIADVMTDYSSAVSGISVNSVTGSIDIANKLLSFINSTASVNTSGVSSFTNAVSELSKTDFSGFASAFSKQSSTFTSVGSKLADALSKGFSGKKSSLTKVASEMMTAMAKSMKDKHAYFTSAGKTLMEKISEGMKYQKAKVSGAATAPLSSAVTSIKGYYAQFYSAGSYLVSGFTNGISKNSYKAAAQAKAMARAAYVAAKSELDINSPSRVFRKLGSFVPEGFAQGIDRFSRISTRSTESMAKQAIASAQTALSQMALAVDSDMSDAPTITPVLDLSNVQSGMVTLGSMLNGVGSVGLSANLNAIGSMRAARRQNGNNNDVVSAIKGLSKDINNMDRNSYSINGITYSQGTEVAEAIETLVRATIIGGRS